MGKEKLAHWLTVGGIAAIIIGIILFSYEFSKENEVRKNADAALEKMQILIPARSEGRIRKSDQDEEMSALEVNGFSMVGYVEISGTETVFPVQNRWGTSIVPRLKEGNVELGTAVISTDRIGSSAAHNGMRLMFTDVTGRQYRFSVINIAHPGDEIKNADLIIECEGMKSEIMLICRESDL